MPFLSCFSEPPSASLGCLFSFWVQEEPPSLRTEREGGQEFPWLFMRPSRILFVRKEGLFAKPLGASLGRWVSARLQEEPPSLCMEREGRQEFPWLFCTPLAREGLFAEPPSGASLGHGVSVYL